MAEQSSWHKWRFPMLLGLVLTTMLGVRAAYEISQAVRARHGDSQSLPNSAPETAQVVSLEIDFDGALATGNLLEFPALAWQSDMTVLDATRLAASNREGLEVHFTGAGASAFLMDIAGIANDQQSNQFWQYWVNGTRADRGMDVYQLRPGDHVLWKFAAEE